MFGFVTILNKMQIFFATNQSMEALTNKRCKM